MNEGVSSEEELLTIDEAAVFLDTSKSTLYRLLGQGDVKGTKVGKQWRFRKPDLRGYLDRGSVATAVDGASRAELDSVVAAMGFTEVGASDEDKIAFAADALMQTSIGSGVTDIHLEPLQNELSIRCRIDGVLHRTQGIPKSIEDAVITRFKVMAGMNAMEKRMPQDGRIPFEFQNKEYDLRVSCLPTFFGESIVMRVLDKSSVLLDINNLGFDANSLRAIERLVAKPSGIIIATGPSGSGKTTLLYSCLSKINSQAVKIVTIEDPIEQLLPGVMQAGVNKRAGLTFGAGLRSFLRQDPDVILVGEARDVETCQIAIEAALSGHLVLTALLTEDAPETLLRLADMGIERYLTAATVAGVVSLRLARRLCPACKTVADPDDAAIMLEKVRKASSVGGYAPPSKTVLYDAVGCSECRETGYHGRIGLHEVLTCDSKLVGQLLQCGSREEMTRIAVASGMRTLMADGVSKAVAGETTIAEVIRSTGSTL